MVMGKVTHTVEVILERGSYNSSCTCYWGGKYSSRALALSASHLHLSESLGAHDTRI